MAVTATCIHCSCVRCFSQIVSCSRHRSIAFFSLVLLLHRIIERERIILNNITRVKSHYRLNFEPLNEIKSFFLPKAKRICCKPTLNTQQSQTYTHANIEIKVNPMLLVVRWFGNCLKNGFLDFDLFHWTFSFRSFNYRLF